MKIGIDFDNTLVNTMEISKKYLDIYLPGNNLSSYHELEYDKEVEFFEMYHLDITKDLSLFEYVKEAFNYFKENNIKTYLITARGYDNPDLIEPTKEFLKNNNIEFDDMIFSCPKKTETCQKLGIDLMIDDSVGVIKNLDEVGIKGVVFGKENDTYKYVNNWKEVIKMLQKGDLCE